MQDKILKSLKKYLEKEPAVLLAFVFGSYAKGLETMDSDFDIAVYFSQKQRGVEIDDETLRQQEDEIWSKISDIIRKEMKIPKLPEVSVVCLNMAPASLVSNVFKTGIPLTIKDKKLYWELYLRVSSEAEDFLEFLESFRRIKQKSESISKEEEGRLLIRIDYLENSMKELDRFSAFTQSEYVGDIDKRRNMERWTENILNAVIDIAKIVLASERKEMPRSYEDVLFYFGIFAGLTEEEARKLAKLARLRNIVAHEYLDILYARIQNFIKEFPPIYEKVFNFLKKYLK